MTSSIQRLHIVLLFLVPLTLSAEEVTVDTTSTTTPVVIKQEPKTGSATEDLQRDWGLSLGVGVEFYGDEYIENASLQGTERVVTVEDGYNSQPAVWLVGNWSIDKCDTNRLVDTFCSTWIKPGFYVGARLLGTDGETLQGISLGLQLAFLQNIKVLQPARDGQGQELVDRKKPSWNLGIGWVNHTLKRFATGVVEGEPLPSQFDDIIYREESDNSWVLMISKGIY